MVRSPKILSALAALSAVLLSPHRLRAAVPNAEDLSACKLPNGVVIMPAPGTPAAQKGELLKLSTGQFTWSPSIQPGQVLTPAEVADRIRANNSADLQYIPGDHGAFWAISGRISELGALYLFDAGAMKLEPPMELRATSRNPAGMYNGIAEGRTYLVQTVDNHYALVRVLERTPESLTIQYVYQPASILSFDIPRGNLVDFHRPDATRPGTDTPSGLTNAGSPRVAATLPAPRPRQPLGADDIVEPGRIILRSNPVPVQPAPARSLPPAPTPAPAPAVVTADPVTAPAPAPSGQVAMQPAGNPEEFTLSSFLAQRDRLIQERIAIVSGPAKGPAELERKTQAMLDLASLHADDAAPLLVSQITFLNTRSQSREFSMDALHPSVAALKRLGKPATAACLQALRELNMSAPGEGIDAPMYRAKLLGVVIRSVEGDAAGDFLLTQEMNAQADPGKRAVFEYLLNKN